MRTALLRFRATNWLASVVLLASLLPAAPAAATTLQPMTGPELAATAESIVVGRATNIESRWFDRSLVTLVTVEVSETWKGDAVTEVTVAIPGGVDLDREVPIAVTLPGAPVFSTGEDLLLFLQPQDGFDGFSIVGLSQGAFPLLQTQEKTLVTQSRGQLTGSLALDTVRQRVAEWIAGEGDVR